MTRPTAAAIGLLLWLALSSGLSSRAASPAAAASGAATAGGEQARITAERKAAEARFVERDKECRQRFVVSSCVADARRDRRTTLDSLRARQRVIDEARRRQRASERRDELSTKADEDARRERDRVAKAALAASAPASSSREGKPFEQPREKKPRSPPKRASAAERQATEERSRSAFGKRQEEAATHREDTIDSAIRRMGKKSPARPLPIPASGAASVP